MRFGIGPAIELFVDFIKTFAYGCLFNSGKIPFDIWDIGFGTLSKAGSTDDIRFERSVDMRFVGQGAETNVSSIERDFAGVEKTTVRKRFDEIYEKLYGRTYPESQIEFVNFKVRASLPERLLNLPKIERSGESIKDAIKGQRPAFSGIAKAFIPFTVYDRYRLFPTARFQGPAIIEERESTVIVGEDAAVSVDEYGFLWIELSTAQG